MKFQAIRKFEMMPDKPDKPDMIRLPVLPEGKFEHPWYGTLVWDQTTLEQMVANFKNGNGYTVPMLNCDHSTHMYDCLAPAAGWIEDLEYESGSGLFAVVELTDIGKQAIENRHYRYTSAEVADILETSDGQAFRNVITGLALTNSPFHDTMPGIFSSNRVLGEYARSRDEGTLFRLTGGPMTTPQDQEHEPRWLGKVMGAITALGKPAPEANPTAELQADLAAAKVAISALSKQVEEMGVALKVADECLSVFRANEKTAREVEAARKVNALVAAGRLISGKRDEALALALSDAKVFDTFSSMLPQVVPTGAPQVLSGGGEGKTQTYTDAVRARMEADTNLDFASAARAVALENPALFHEYRAGFNQARSRKVA